VPARAKWVEACWEAHRLAAVAKQQSWIDFVEDLEHHADPAKVWRIIKSLIGTPGSNGHNEAMILNGRTILSYAGKVNAFLPTIRQAKIFPSVNWIQQFQR